MTNMEILFWSATALAVIGGWLYYKKVISPLLDRDDRIKKSDTLAVNLFGELVDLDHPQKATK